MSLAEYIFRTGYCWTSVS